MGADTKRSVWKRITSNFGRVLIGLLLLSVVLNTFLGLRAYFQRPAWDPFGDYPEQEVIRPEETIGMNTSVGVEHVLLPTIHYVPGTEIKATVTGTKCSAIGEPFTIHGQTTYEITYPETVVITGAKGEGQRKPGCDTRTFDNVLPADVVERINQFVSPGNPVIMKIRGAETAIEPDGTDGAVQAWETEEFAIVVD